MSFRDVESLHRRELVTPSRVRDLKGTYVLLESFGDQDRTFSRAALDSYLVATYHLSVCVLNRRDVRVLKRICV